MSCNILNFNYLSTKLLHAQDTEKQSFILLLQFFAIWKTPGISRMYGQSICLSFVAGIKKSFTEK